MQKTKEQELELVAIAQQLQLGRAWVGLKVCSRQTARCLLRRWEEVFQQWASLLGVEEFRLSLPDGSYLSIASTLAPNSPAISTVSAVAIQTVYAAPGLPINAELHRLMQRLIESDRPMFLLSNDTDHQVWINQKACDMIQSNGEEAVRRCMRDYWDADDLQSLHQKLRDTSQPFEHGYHAILNDVQNDVWFQAVSRYEPVEIGGRSFRLSINQSFQIVGQRQPA